MREKQNGGSPPRQRTDNRQPTTVNLYLVTSLVAFVVLRLLIPHIRLFGATPDMIVFTTIFMAAQILVIRYICALQVKFAPAGIAFLLSLAAFSGLLFVRRTMDEAIYLSLALDITRILTSVFLGYLVSFILREKNIILPIAAFSAFIDVWTVTWGPTKQMVTMAPQIVEAVSAPILVPGGGGKVVGFIGPADLVFLALFFGAIYKLKMEPARTFWYVLPFLSLAMLAVTMTDYFTGLPALVPMAFGVVIANFRHFKLSKQEGWSVAIMSIMLSLALAAHLLHRAAR
ncbi:MAG: hypothetical protein Q7N50_08705 [Armatimonadota bacterium]|nr:hypothetical protein [Armatimonadota bacterium]